MLTLFAVPKPFEGHIGTIQRNAIRSWTRIRPTCQIVLLGDDTGTRKMAEEVGAHHEPTVAVNELGTPLVNDIFSRAETCSTSKYLCYVNADIILFTDLCEALARLDSLNKPFLMVGRRHDLDVKQALEFRSGWRERLVSRTEKDGELHAVTGIDYFVFRHGLFGEIPEFALGRTVWDNWLLYRARASRAWLIDATQEVLAVHQNHTYGAKGKDGVWDGTEARKNHALSGSPNHAFSIADATHVLDGSRLRTTTLRPPLRRKLEVAAVLNPGWSWFYMATLRLLDLTYPIRARIGLAGH